MDRRQNNGSVKAVSPRHCPATCALRNCCFNCCAGQSLRQCPLHRCWRTTWTTRSKRCPTCSAQLHLPTHDLFWANLRVQLHLPPLRSLDLLISPGTLIWRWGKREIIYLSLRCHHQNDSCIKMGSDESHFNVSVGSDEESHKTVSTNHNLFEEMRVEAVSNRGPSTYR